MQKYYDIFGVNSRSTKEEIKKAFHKLAHIHHPDKNGGNDKKFKEINEAYTMFMKQATSQPFQGYTKADQGFNVTWSPGTSSQSDFFYKMYKEQAQNNTDFSDRINKMKKDHDELFRKFYGKFGI